MTRGLTIKGSPGQPRSPVADHYSPSMIGKSIFSKQLGVSKSQANGGAGSIFQMVKQNLSVDDFSSIARVVPGIEKMMGAATKSKKKTGSLGDCRRC